MTTHSVYDTVKGAAVGTYLQVRTAAASAYLGVGVLQRSRPNARARRGIRLNFADSDHQQQVIAGSCRPPIAHTHAMPVPVRPIGRTGTEVNAVTTSRKSKPRSQSQKQRLLTTAHTYTLLRATASLTTIRLPIF